MLYLCPAVLYSGFHRTLRDGNSNSNLISVLRFKNKLQKELPGFPRGALQMGVSAQGGASAGASKFTFWRAPFCAAGVAARLVKVCATAMFDRRASTKLRIAHASNTLAIFPVVFCAS